MNRTCATCGIAYDDAMRSTLCRHEPIYTNPDDMERKILGLTLLGKTVRFAHQVDGPDRRVSTLHWNGMVELHGDDIVGEFAPHLFVIVEEKPQSTKCPNCGRVSYHPDDIRNRYCGHCHGFYIDWEKDAPK